MKKTPAKRIASRCRATAELNKGKLKHSLSRAVFFHRLGEVRDRFFKDECLRASGLNLAIAGIVLWNTVYLENAVNWLKSQGVIFPEEYFTSCYRDCFFLDGCYFNLSSG